MFFAIKLKNFDVWLGKKNLSYFIEDDSYFALTKQGVEVVLFAGVVEKRRRVFSSTDQIRRSLNRVNKETVVKPIVLLNSLNSEILTKGNSLGKFSNFVVVNLTNDETYPLDDVISGIV
jgi:hypothetical protein